MQIIKCIKNHKIFFGFEGLFIVFTIALPIIEKFLANKILDMQFKYTPFDTTIDFLIWSIAVITIGGASWGCDNDFGGDKSCAQ